MMYLKETMLSITNLKKCIIFIVLNFVFHYYLLLLDLDNTRVNKPRFRKTAHWFVHGITVNQNLKSQLIDISHVSSFST